MQVKKRYLLTNPRSKSRSDLGVSLKSDFPTTPTLRPPRKYKISKKEEDYNQNKSCQLTWIEFKYVFEHKLKLKFEVEVWS